MGKFEISEEIIDRANAQSALEGVPLDITHRGWGPNLPAVNISWYEAARFANWLNTTSGVPVAYKFDDSGEFQLWQPGEPGYNSSNPYRNTRARYVLPSADE
jgi:hypothetical protein